jgi:hypothetical protein
VDIVQALLILIALFLVGEVILILLLLKLVFYLGIVGVILWTTLKIATLLGFKPKRKIKQPGFIVWLSGCVDASHRARSNSLCCPDDCSEGTDALQPSLQESGRGFKQ